jgi:hypothetical protein
MVKILSLKGENLVYSGQVYYIQNGSDIVAMLTPENVALICVKENIKITKI